MIAKTVSTFKSLAEQAEFAPIQEHTELQMTSGPLHTPAAPGANAAAAASSGTGPTGVALHIDIQIHISPEASADQIDQIFASMAKHLYGST